MTRNCLLRFNSISSHKFLSSFCIIRKRSNSNHLTHKTTANNRTQKTSFFSLMIFGFGVGVLRVTLGEVERVKAFFADKDLSFFFKTKPDPDTGEGVGEVEDGEEERGEGERELEEGVRIPLGGEEEGSDPFEFDFSSEDNVNFVSSGVYLCVEQNLEKKRYKLKKKKTNQLNFVSQGLVALREKKMKAQDNHLERGDLCGLLRINLS
eukprot:CAMPEP_0201505370 /NCGR_PEP_ID=MMETSP0151_2-20130828/85725_1 /ASSEMBLY_ACC=CAM_ASM_000257 /TAXON_ID=200890 /ORGANISM="Paramoeba atlantica, Strain 621/1 / CCAP 1560/9" /LENGTH=207 /DNA_ID=CAMNT_0047899219 /DNA_START=558 /DNA_END=1182 /DNA_ORIENTATION=+